MKSKHTFAILIAVVVLAIIAFLHKADSLFVTFDVTFIISMACVMVDIDDTVEHNQECRYCDNLKIRKTSNAIFVGFIVYLCAMIPVIMGTGSMWAELTTLSGAIIGSLISFELYSKEVHAALANPTLPVCKK